MLLPKCFEQQNNLLQHAEHSNSASESMKDGYEVSWEVKVRVDNP